MPSTQSFSGKAIVCHDTLQSGGWKLEDVTTKECGDDELVVEMLASGICHTDVMVGTAEAPNPMALYPRVLGHEGSGYVRAVGKNVKVAAAGDPVLLSYASCGKCALCEDKSYSYCLEFVPRNFGGRPSFAFKSDTSKDVHGSFFGQSSFANYSIVHERSVVNVKGLVTDKKELALFSPLGCGIQTGSGSVLNAAKAQPKDSIVIIGQGGVGLSAIMGAAIAGCKTIIGVDRVESRLALTKELGATHVINGDKLPEGKSIVEAIRDLTDGLGPTITIDTSGVPALIKAGVEWTRQHGRIYQVGSAPPDFNLEVPVFNFMVAGKSFNGAIEGEADPAEFVPKMIQWYREGRFPIDKFIKFLPADKFDEGLKGMKTGETIKPVLLWS